MRTPLLLAVAALVLTACTSGSTTPPASTPPAAVNPPAPTSPSAPSVLTWGGEGTSSGVYLKLAAPVAVTDPVIGTDGKPDPARKFVEVPVTAGNKTTGKARLSFSGRVGSKEAPWTASDSVPEALPGETAELAARFNVPVDATELVVEVYANIDGAVTTNRLNYKGPIS